MRWVWCAVAALVLATGGGCSKPELPVNGIVTLDNEPLSGAAVTFYPDEKTGGTSGTATTGSDGKFVIIGAKGQKGLLPGKYKVTVSKVMGEVTDEPVVAAPSEVELKSDLPPIYSDPNQTILSYSVTGDGQPIEIKLSSKPKK